MFSYMVWFLFSVRHSHLASSASGLQLCLCLSSSQNSFSLISLPILSDYWSIIILFNQYEWQIFTVYKSLYHRIKLGHRANFHPAEWTQLLRMLLLLLDSVSDHFITSTCVLETSDPPLVSQIWKSSLSISSSFPFCCGLSPKTYFLGSLQS